MLYCIDNEKMYNRRHEQDKIKTQGIFVIEGVMFIMSIRCAAWRFALILICCLLVACRPPVEEVVEELPVETVIASPKPTPTLEPLATPESISELPVNAEYLEQLRREYDNGDIIGYLKIEGTSIDYPVVQTGNNQFYLDHNIYKESDRAGWVFLDFENDTSRDDPNTIIYAHNMRDDVMFHSLRNYTSKDYFENHRYITFNTEYADQTWEVFSFYRAPTSFYYIQVFFPTHDDFVKLLMEMKSRSMYDTGVEVFPEDRVLILSTCVGGNDRNERYVLNARLIGDKDL